MRGCLAEGSPLGGAIPGTFRKKPAVKAIVWLIHDRIPTYILLLKPGVPPRETGLCTSGGSTLQSLRSVRPWSRSLGILSGSFQVGDLVSEPKFPHL